MLLGSDILRLFFTGPYLVSLPLCSVSGVDCPSVDPRQLLLPASLLSCDQLLTLVLASLWVASSTLILGSPYHFRIRRDFMSKNPLSGFAPKQTIESSALAAYPHSATEEVLRLLFINTWNLSSWDWHEKPRKYMYVHKTIKKVQNFSANILFFYYKYNNFKREKVDI